MQNDFPKVTNINNSTGQIQVPTVYETKVLFLSNVVCCLPVLELIIKML